MDKKINLYDLIKLVDNEELSKEYIRYLMSWDDKKQYRHLEIKCIKDFLDYLNLSKDLASNFIYSYEIPQLNKEFDLIKIFKDFVINIELKSSAVPDERILKQLQKNKHYLSLIEKDIYQFCFIADEQKLLKLADDELIDASSDDLINLLSSQEDETNLDLSQVFTIGQVLISPLNNPVEFYNRNYLLTQAQEEIKEDIFNNIRNGAHKYYSITGNAGTGKTLLLYDIARNISSKNDVLIIHSGMVCKGHKEINRILKKIKITPISMIRSVDLNKYKYIFVDEAHRLYLNNLEELINHIESNEGCFCIFSYDEKQKMSKSENNSMTLPRIRRYCDNYAYELKNTIRCNKNVARFVEVLMNLNEPTNGVDFSNIHIVYEPDQVKAVELAKTSTIMGYEFISYTPSRLVDTLDYQKTNRNTHDVIGQEFDKVCMILNDFFSYDNRKKLQARQHPCPDYLLIKLLYQGLTRARNEILLIVTTEELLENVLGIFKK